MNPSLLLIPDRYKASKLYSQIPDSGAGDLAFTRANDTATRVNSAGLIEKVRTNLILQSQTFDTASWININATITANTSAAPDGTLTADRLTDDAVNSVHITISTINWPAAQRTCSLFVKQGTANKVYIANATFGFGVFFNLSTATIDGAIGAITGTIESLPNGWYRITATHTAASASSLGFGIYETFTGIYATTAEYAGTGKHIELWGAQLEAGDIATPYIPTTTAAVSVGMLANIPRIDYTGGGCGKLLLEPQRTNIALFSEQFNNAAFAKFGSSVSANQAVSPDGYTNGDKLLPNNGISVTIAAGGIFTSGAAAYVRSGALTLTAASYTFSIFVKKAELDYVQLRSGTSVDLTANGSGNIANLNNGTAATANSVQDYGNGWYRISHTFTATAATWYVGIWFWNTTSLTANGSQGIFAYGAQLEVGSYPTSYIPTLGASVTRSADAASKTGISSLIGQTSGTLYCEVVYKANDNGTYLSIEDWANLELVRVYSNAGKLNAQIYNVSNIFLSETIFSAVVGQTYKMAFSYSTTGSAFYVNGTLISETTSALSIPACENARLAAFTTAQEMNADIKTAALYTTRLSNADLATLTSL